MTPPIQIHVQDEIDLEGALVVVGAPGLGFVGAIATRYLVENLDMARVGGFHSPEFPAYTIVENGRVLHPVRIHTMETRCGLDLQCDRIVVLSSELFVGPQLVYPLADAIVSWVKSFHAEMILVPDAIVPAEEGDEESDRIHGVAARPEGAAFLDRADVPALGDGVLMGLTAALLSESEQMDLNTVALLAESRPDHPDARAAARLVEVLDRVLPGIKLESQPLIERAKAIEANVQRLREEMRKHAQQGDRGMGPDLSMFH